MLARWRAETGAESGAESATTTNTTSCDFVGGRPTPFDPVRHLGVEKRGHERQVARRLPLQLAEDGGGQRAERLASSRPPLLGLGLGLGLGFGFGLGLGLRQVKR